MEKRYTEALSHARDASAPLLTKRIPKTDTACDKYMDVLFRAMRQHQKAGNVRLAKSFETRHRQALAQCYNPRRPQGRKRMWRSYVEEVQPAMRKHEV